MKIEQIQRKFVKNYYRQERELPDCYWHHSWFVRNLFYRRLEIILDLLSDQINFGKTVCDFGGGRGVFLPTLSKNFKRVVLIDKDTYLAEKIIQKYNIKNAEIVRSDILLKPLPSNEFDIVVAADVLEHFQNLEPVINEIGRILKPNGLLLVSAPSENLFYRLGRKIWRIEKPVDHYHNAKEIERALLKESFSIEKKFFIPLNISFFAIFRILRLRKKQFI